MHGTSLPVLALMSCDSFLKLLLSSSILSCTPLILSKLRLFIENLCAFMPRCYWVKLNQALWQNNPFKVTRMASIEVNSMFTFTPVLSFILTSGPNTQFAKLWQQSLAGLTSLAFHISHVNICVVIQNKPVVWVLHVCFTTFQKSHIL